MEPWVLVVVLAGGPVLNAGLVLWGMRMFRLKVTPVALREQFAVEFGEYQERVDNRFGYLDRQLARLTHLEEQLKAVPRELHVLTTAVQKLSAEVATLRAAQR